MNKTNHLVLLALPSPTMAVALGAEARVNRTWRTISEQDADLPSAGSASEGSFGPVHVALGKQTRTHQISGFKLQALREYA